MEEASTLEFLELFSSFEAYIKDLYKEVLLNKNKENITKLKIKSTDQKKLLVKIANEETVDINSVDDYLMGIFYSKTIF